MDFEVSVIGAGAVGSVLALLLAQQGLKVCLIDRSNPFEINTVSNLGTRTTALNLASVELVKQAGFWESLKKESTPFNRIYVWDSKGSTKLEFLAKDIKIEHLGYVISNNSIQKEVFKILKNFGNLTFKPNNEISEIKVEEDKVIISNSQGSKITSQLLIGADGVNSVTRKFSKIKSRTWKYNQNAFVTSLKSEKHHKNTAWQIFTPSGTIALLPFDAKDEANISLVWSAERKYSEYLNSLDERAFVSELEKKTEYILGSFEPRGLISSFPLNQLHTKSYFSERIVLAGDSAHSIHPLAGQGLNLGFADALSLTEKLTSARRRAEDLGSDLLLSSYEDSRKIPNLTMTVMMEVLKQGFEQTDPWIKLARNLAFKTTQETNWLKEKFIKEAAGIT